MPKISQVDTSITVLIKDVKSSGTAGGTFTSGSWQTRTLNTLENSRPWVSLVANQFALLAGTYLLEASAPAKQIQNHKARLRNITDSTDTSIGSSEQADNSTDITTTRSIIYCRFTITASKTFEIQHQCITTRSTDGFGSAGSFGVSEVYTMVKITKLG